MPGPPVIPQARCAGRVSRDAPAPEGPRATILERLARTPSPSSEMFGGDAGWRHLARRPLQTLGSRVHPVLPG